MEKSKNCSCGNNEEYYNCSCGNAEEHCECGCEHESQTMTLVLNNNQEIECSVIGIFDVKDKEYIALLPIGEESVLLYQYVETDDENFELLNIEADDEFKAVEDAFFDMFDDEIYENEFESNILE